MQAGSLLSHSQHPLAATPSMHGAVGVFDSGIGGVSVLHAIRQALPEEALIYCADSRYNPYGERSDAFVIERSLAISQWLIAQGAKVIVVACNTATTIAIQTLRQELNIPVIGVEPGVKPAVELSQSRVAGVLATAGTLRSEKFQRLLQTYAQHCKLICTAGLGLVEAIEAGDISSPALETRLRGYLQPMLDAGADTLALGCTHYPFLLPLIRRIVGVQMQVIDNSIPIARQLTRQLEAHTLRRPASDAGTSATAFFSTGATAQLDILASHALAEAIIARTVSIPSPAVA